MKQYRLLLSVLFLSLISLGGLLTYLSHNAVILAAPSSPRLYVTVSDGFLGQSKVTVLDTGNNSIVANISVDDDPFDVKFNTDGTRAYVVHQQSNSISVIDTSTNTVTATIPLGLTSYPDNYPVGISINSTGSRAYTVNQGADANNLVIVDTSTNSVVNTIPAGQVIGVAAKPGSNLVYVTTNDQELKVIDTTTNSIVNTISLLGVFPQMVFNASGTRLYLASSDGVILVMDATTNTEITRTLVSQVFGNPVLSSDEASLYTTGANCSVSVMTTANNQWVEAIPSPIQGSCGGVAVNPADRRLFISNNNGAYTLSVLDRLSGGTVAVIPMGGSPRGLAIKP